MSEFCFGFVKLIHEYRELFFPLFYVKSDDDIFAVRHFLTELKEQQKHRKCNYWKQQFWRQSLNVDTGFDTFLFFDHEQVKKWFAKQNFKKRQTFVHVLFLES
jgi:hypothetical protein